MLSREKEQADFDLERFINMFDEALTSNDERVVNALRSLMMMVILTKPESHAQADRNRGPLRQLYDDVHNINRRLNNTEDMVRRLERTIQPTEIKSWQNLTETTSQSASDYFWRDQQYKEAEAIKKINSPGLKAGPGLLAQINPSKINKEI